MADLLAVLYGGCCASAGQPDWPDRDRFILSKGHGCAALYAALAERGFFPRDWLEPYYQNGSCLAATSRTRASRASSSPPGRSATACRSAAGWPGRRSATAGLARRSCCSATASATRDRTGRRSCSRPPPARQSGRRSSTTTRSRASAASRTLALEPFADKWRAFGWAVGRDRRARPRELRRGPRRGCRFERGRPSCVLAHTVKGKGVSFMENPCCGTTGPPGDAEFEPAAADVEVTGRMRTRSSSALIELAAARSAHHAGHRRTSASAWSTSSCRQLPGAVPQRRGGRAEHDRPRRRDGARAADRVHLLDRELPDAALPRADPQRRLSTTTPTSRSSPSAAGSRTARWACPTTRPRTSPSCGRCRT